MPRLSWLARRLAATLAIVIAVVTLVFAAVHLAPGTPFLPADGRALDPAVTEALRRRFGLDRPLAIQYARYLGRLAHGDLGESFSRQEPVAEALAAALPNTIVLAAAALALDLLLGTALGVWQAALAARRPRLDAALTGVTIAVYALPTFWLGLVLLLVFGQALHWLPVGGVVDPVMHDALPWGGRVGDRLRHLVLPALALGLVGAAGTARYQRAALLDVLGLDYVRAARARGLGAARVMAHALRNALLPGITLLGLSLPFLLTGSVVVETVFAWPGMGKLAADAILSRDYPVVLAVTLVAAVLVALGSLLADLLYAAADPRIGRTP